MPQYICSQSEARKSVSLPHSLKLDSREEVAKLAKRRRQPRVLGANSMTSNVPDDTENEAAQPGKHEPEEHLLITPEHFLLLLDHHSLGSAGAKPRRRRIQTPSRPDR